MNLDITQSATTTATDSKSNTTLTASPIGTFSIPKVNTDATSKDSSSGIEWQSSSNSGSILNEKIRNSSNSIDVSESFISPQNNFELLTSIENQTVSDNIVSTTTFDTFALNLPKYSTSNATLLNNADDKLQPMKLVLPELLVEETNPIISENSTYIENTIKSTLSTISNSINSTANVFKYDNVTSRVDEIQNESTVYSSFIDDDFELNLKERGSSCSESKISVHSANILRCDEDSISKSSENSGHLIRSIYLPDSTDKIKNVTRLSERAKKKSWYNVLYPNYKSRSQNFKKLFKEVPNDERLIVVESDINGTKIVKN